MMKRSRQRRRVPGPRRAVTWVSVVLAIGVVLVVAALDKGAGVVFGQVLRIGVGLVAWGLTVLTWDLAVVWTEYVSRSRHLRLMRNAWRVPDRTKASGVSPVQVSADHLTGLWWLDPSAPKSPMDVPWWVKAPMEQKQ